jgi:hypothetical protein
VPVAFENLQRIGRIEVAWTPDAEAAQEVGERRADSIDPDQVGECEGASKRFAVQVVLDGNRPTFRRQGASFIELLGRPDPGHAQTFEFRLFEDVELGERETGLETYELTSRFSTMRYFSSTLRLAANSAYRALSRSRPRRSSRLSMPILLSSGTTSVISSASIIRLGRRSMVRIVSSNASRLIEVRSVEYIVPLACAAAISTWYVAIRRGDAPGHLVCDRWLRSAK